MACREGVEKYWWNEIGETGEPKKNPKKIPPLPTTIGPLATPKLELGTLAGTDERSNCSYTGIGNSN